MEMKQNLGVKVLLGLGVACLSGCSFSEKETFPAWQEGEMEIHHIYT